jgi:hypothetical protein
MREANFIPGNIIFDIVLVEPANLTVAHHAGLSAPTITGGTGAAASRKGAAAKATGLVINPSNGAECRALFRTVEILPNHILPSAIADVST